jgi:leucyl aminopeptidase
MLARDLVNMPPNDLNPETFAAKIKELAEIGVDVEVLGEKQLAKLGMNCHARRRARLCPQKPSSVS